MAVNLSPFGGVGAQFLDNSGNVLTGGKIFTYAAGTTTNQPTYTSSLGNTPLSNPIILNAAGRVPTGEIWLTDGLSYKFVLTDSNDVLIATYDNITGINSNFVAFTNEQEIQTATAGQTVFNLTTTTYQPATNSLSVFVDGVNQYGPGAQYAYVETDSDTVTFVNGLHVGAEVKFTTSQLNSSGLQANAFQVSYTPPFTSSATTNVGDKLAQTISVEDFGAVGDGVTDDTAAIQAAVDYCVANQKDLLISSICLITSSINIDRLVDSANADNYFTIGSVSGGGIVVSSAIPIFSTTLVNPSNSNLPASQMVRFNGLKFESTNSALSAYVLDENKFLRVLFESCNFRKIKCLDAPVGKLTQTITFQNCQARRWSGTFFTSSETTFDLKVIGGLWEAGGDAFDLRSPVGTAFIGANIEGMASFAIKYTGGYALTVQGCYFEQNGDTDPNGCSIDGSAGLGINASENVSLVGNYFSGDSDTPAKPQVKWGDCVTAFSTGNLCTTTLHEFNTISRVNIVADYARTALSTNDPTIYNGIRNELQIGAVFRTDTVPTSGGIVRSEFVPLSGAFLRLRTLQLGTESATGLDIDNNGDVKITGNADLAKYIDINEMTPPSPPTTNQARLYAKDNGAGKTQLVVQFETGAVQILATEP
jgi:hypothetical protein